MKRTPLKRKASLGAGYDYDAFREGIRFLDGLDCWVRRLLEEQAEDHPHDYSPSMLACAGELDGHHLIRKNRLKQEFPNGTKLDVDIFLAEDYIGPHVAEIPLSIILEDPRNGILVCRRHHDALEGPELSIRRDELPKRVFEFAEEYGLEGWLDRYYPPIGRAA